MHQSDFDAFAVMAGEEMWKRVEAALKLKLTARGLADMAAISPDNREQLYREAVLGTAIHMPGADLAMLNRILDGIFRSDLSDAIQRLLSKSNEPYDAFDFASGRDAAVLMAFFGLPVAPMERASGAITSPLTTEVNAVVQAFETSEADLVGYLRELRDVNPTPENALAPIKASGGFGSLHMIEGVLLHTPLNFGAPENSNVNSVSSYALTHRGGRIDVAWSVGGIRPTDTDPVTLAWPDRFESGLDEAVQHGIGRLTSYGVEGPWLISASVERLKNAHLMLNSDEWSEPAWRSSGALGEVLAEDLPGALAGLDRLKAAFWLAFGVPRGA